MKLETAAASRAGRRTDQVVRCAAKDAASRRVFRWGRPTGRLAGMFRGATAAWRSRCSKSVLDRPEAAAAIRCRA